MQTKKYLVLNYILLALPLSPRSLDCNKLYDIIMNVVLSKFISPHKKDVEYIYKTSEVGKVYIFHVLSWCYAVSIRISVKQDITRTWQTVKMRSRRIHSWWWEPGCPGQASGDHGGNNGNETNTEQPRNHVHQSSSQDSAPRWHLSHDVCWEGETGPSSFVETGSEQDNHKVFMKINVWNQYLHLFRDGWKTLMKDYKGGVDYPVSFFYKELLEVYPDAKVLMNVRDPVKWYESVRDSIMRVSDIMRAWPQSWMSVIMGINDFSNTISGLSDPVPTSSSKGARCNMNLQFQLHITLKLFKTFNKC